VHIYSFIHIMITASHDHPFGSKTQLGQKLGEESFSVLEAFGIRFVGEVAGNHQVINGAKFSKIHEQRLRHHIRITVCREVEVAQVEDVIARGRCLIGGSFREGTPGPWIRTIILLVALPERTVKDTIVLAANRALNVVEATFQGGQNGLVGERVLLAA
jgi:hypothetical protein